MLVIRTAETNKMKWRGGGNLASKSLQSRGEDGQIEL